MRMVKLPKV